MRKSPLGLIILIVLLAAGAGVAVFFMLRDDSPRPVPRPRVAELETDQPAGNGPALQPADQPEPDSPPEINRTPKPEPQPEVQPEPKPEPEPEPKPEPKPEEGPATGPQAHGYPKPSRVGVATIVGGKAGEALAFGTVFDQDRQPLNGASLQVYIVRTKDGNSVFESVRGPSTGKDGRFSLAIQYTQHEGETAEFAIAAARTGYCLSSVKTPEPDSPIDLQLHAFSNETTIEGEVVDSDGAIVTGAHVYCTGKLNTLDPESLLQQPVTVQNALATAAATDWNGSAVTDQFGRFMIKRAPPGVFTVWCGNPDQKGEPLEIEVISGRSNMLSQSLTLPQKKQQD